METATATPTESAPAPQLSAPSNASQSEQEFLQSHKTPKEPSKQPTDQVLPINDGQEQLPGEQPNDLPPTVEYKIRDTRGNEKVITPEWMTKFYQVVGNEELAPLVQDPRNAPLLTHIAEKTLKLNEAYREASTIRPQYETYKGEVETYFNEIRQAPDEGFERMMSDMGISDADQEAIIEKMALKLIEKREMSPDQRAAQAALREQQRSQQEIERYKQEAEELKTNMESQQRAPVYQTGMASALAHVGLEVNDSTWAAMVQVCKQQYGSQKEPISQEQFNAVAKHLATLGMSFKKQAAPVTPEPPKRVVSKGYQGTKAPQQPAQKFQSEQDFLNQFNMKKY